MNLKLAGWHYLTKVRDMDPELIDPVLTGPALTDPALIGSVRRFNRTVTERIGALEDSFLSRGRPLGQARVLWEIGPDGTRVRALRARLGLDSGYLSRMLRALEAAKGIRIL